MEFYRGKRVLVTGGLGFIGSNLVRKLVKAGASVTVVDAAFPDQGANLFNLKGVLEDIVLVIADIGNLDEVSNYLVDQEVIFNLASSTSHVGSMQDPVKDLERNCLSHLRFLGAIRELSPGARIVYTGSRSQYGNPLYQPVDEDHPTRPVDINGIHKCAVEEYHRLYHRLSHIRYTSLRLTNVFGPRHQMLHDGHGFLNWFIRKALSGEDLQVFGDGRQERDFLYVEDAVDAILLAGASTECEGRVFNVSSEVPISVAEAARAVAEMSGVRWKCVPYPKERLSIEPGSVRISSRRFRETTGWSPSHSFLEGLEKTIDFYRRHGHRYFHPSKGRVSLKRDMA
ncbi:MAG: NAD-dependent epimerase/dehydratase family protein [Candidatus Geothermincolales bacterium]